ncbi:MAG: HAMP domain-containing sensor histidine kinase [Bacteroidota bacterium]
MGPPQVNNASEHALGPLNAFIIGKGDKLEGGGLKLALLRGQFALLGIFLGLVYVVVVCIQGEFQYIPFHGVLIGSSLLILYLNRIGRYTAATLGLYVLSTSFVWMFTAVGRPQDGMFFYFFITNFLAIILVGYKNHLLRTSLMLITGGLAMLAYFYPVSPIPTPADQTPEMVTLIFLINLTVSLFFASFVLLSLMNENYNNESRLLKSQETLNAKNTELAKANEELDRFVYSASHDMRAPLSSMSGLIMLAGKTENAEEVRTCLAMMNERIEVMNGFITEITDYSRNVRLPVEKKAIRLRSFIESLTGQHQFSYQSENIMLNIIVPEDLTLVTDESRLRVVLNNVISNAIKYRDPEKGIPCINILCDVDNCAATIRVEDNGIGIGREHISKVFDMFYRASSTSTGSGLGLYIVSEAMQKLEGSISVESELGRGSKFIIRLPGVS